MALVVQKFGGTSVGSTERIGAVVERVTDAREQGYKVVVVVSAMSGETDRLLELANEVNPKPNDREMDVLLAGERRKYTPGEHQIKPVGEAVQNLPEGEFVLTVHDQKLTLAWVPTKRAKWGRVERVVELK